MEVKVGSKKHGFIDSIDTSDNTIYTNYNSFNSNNSGTSLKEMVLSVVRVLPSVFIFYSTLLLFIFGRNKSDCPQ